MDTAERLLRLLSLLAARSWWTGEELADRLEITERTVRRDVTRLRNAGYPVEALSGPYGGYRLGTGTRLPPLVLDDDEAVAVALSLRLSAGSGESGLETASLGALTKLDQMLPAALPRAGRRDRGGDHRPARRRAPRRGDRRADHRRRRLPTGGADPVHLRQQRRRHDQPTGRAVPPRLHRPSVVPRRLRPRAQRLADVPDRPDQRTGRDPRPVPPDRSAGRRCARLPRARLRRPRDPRDGPVAARRGRRPPDDRPDRRHVGGRLCGQRHPPPRWRRRMDRPLPRPTALRVRGPRTGVGPSGGARARRADAGGPPGAHRRPVHRPVPGKTDDKSGTADRRAVVQSGKMPRGGRIGEDTTWGATGERGRDEPSV